MKVIVEKDFGPTSEEERIMSDAEIIEWLETDPNQLFEGAFWTVKREES